ncbi:MAG: hypothetical protein WCF61_13065 [Terriglobales bacterium]
MFLAMVAVASILTFAVPMAAFGWPGLLLVDAVCARFMIYAQTAGNSGPMFVAGLVVDVVIYTLLFFVLSKGWRILAAKAVTKR